MVMEIALLLQGFFCCPKYCKLAAMNTNTVINGVTKVGRAGIFTYHFPLARITANNVSSSVTFNYLDGQPQETLDFSTIDTGLTTPEAYVDALAQAGAFFLPQDDATIAAYLQKINNEQLTSLYSFDKLKDRLDTIIELLKMIGS